jgi:hypothetical protein
MKHFSGKEKMKRMISLLGILTALCFTGCVVEERHERERPAVVVSPPPVVVQEEVVPYDDPGRGWYIEGYYGPDHVWIAPFWTIDIDLVHRHFDHYRGHYRPRFEEHFRHHPERYEDRGHDEHHEEHH